MRRRSQLVAIAALAGGLCGVAGPVQAAAPDRSVAEASYSNYTAWDWNSTARVRFTAQRLTIETTRTLCRGGRDTTLCSHTVETVDQALPPGAARFSGNGRTATLAPTSIVISRRVRSCLRDRATQAALECEDRPDSQQTTTLSASYVGDGRAVRDGGRSPRVVTVSDPVHHAFNQNHFDYFRGYYGQLQDARITTTAGR